MDNSELWENYQKVCNDYLQTFCVKHNFDFEDAKLNWVCDKPGTYVLIGDYSVSMETIIADINENAPVCDFFIWYDYMLETKNNMSYSTWLKYDAKKQIQTMVENFKQLEETKQEFYKTIEPFENIHKHINKHV